MHLQAQNLRKVDHGTCPDLRERGIGRLLTSENFTLGSSPPRSRMSFSRRDSALRLSLYLAPSGLDSTGAADTGELCPYMPKSFIIIE